MEWNRLLLFILTGFAIDRENKLPKKLISKEFYKFLQFYVDSTFRNSFFSVVNYPLIGLGISR